MAYSVLTEQALLDLVEGSTGTRAERVEEALNEAESQGFTFIGVDRPGDDDAGYIFHSAAGKRRLGNVR